MRRLGVALGLLALLLSGCEQPVASTTPVPTRSPATAARVAVIPTPATWSPLVTMPTSVQLSTPSATVVWALVANRYLFLSRDAGSTWERRPDPPLAEAISFQSASDGFALATLGAADGCRISHTTDGGASWTAPVDSAVKGGNCAGAVFVDSATGYVPVPGRVYRTTDAGATWSATAPLPGNPSSFGLIAVGSTLLVLYVPAVANVAVVWLSPDAGRTWPLQAHSRVSLGVLSAIEWLDVAPDGCRHTTDAGATWTDFGCDYTQAAGVAPAITFAGRETGYATVRGSIQRTLDGGHHWERVPTPGA